MNLLRVQQRPPFSSRLSSAISTAEQGEAVAPNTAEHQIDEEIDEIKRYEVGANEAQGCVVTEL